MKVKFFAEAFPNEVEKQINEWLTEKGNGISVSDTTLAFSGVGGDKDASQVVVVAIWYSEKPPQRLT